ncbi:Asp23/Gls24 family envelope stress response protein [Amnibacterium setariae]|uniref:Asp23/Gls24 family envelope stress response protein n=1 Tax=Amnibacterium setariae TaxID=2306585 RepID=A0A3A1U205_9MICO|nr:Asp23/Gls24 family envelope stress response protein [Amnibacterium setariae]RIX28486.1 Asp23/Gls24 family envelope stress response protein [Amnibacterium setariae]
MSNTTPTTTGATTTTAASPAAKRTPAQPTGATTEATTIGTTTIDDSVVEKIAGIAARSVAGVHDLGGGAARAIGALRSRVGGQDRGQGVSVEVGEKQAAVDLVVIAEYPVPLHGLADDVRSAVIDAVEQLTGLEVTEVNITIADIDVPGEDDAKAEPARVR